MAVKRKHSTQARGAHIFAQRLDTQIPDVKDVMLLNVRNSHIKPRRRPPKVFVKDTSVVIHYYKEGSMQRLAVTPQAGISIGQLAQKIRSWLATP